MDSSTRRANFAALIAVRFGGSQAQAAADLGITPGRISQLLDAAQPFGERAARAIEDKLQLGQNYLDRPIQPARTQAPTRGLLNLGAMPVPELAEVEAMLQKRATLTYALPALVKAMQDASPEVREELAQVLSLLARTGSDLYAQRVAELLGQPQSGKERGAA